MTDLTPIDESVLLGIRNGDPSALSTVARTFAGPVYGYLARACGDPTLAEDLAQETALQIFRALPGRRFAHARALAAWVYTVALNAFRMHLRRRRPAEATLDAGLEALAGDEFDPALSAERAETARRIREAVLTLNLPERQALLLKLYADLPLREIARATGEPIGTVKWRLSRAYGRLRELLAPEREPEQAARSGVGAGCTGGCGGLSACVTAPARTSDSTATG